MQLLRKISARTVFGSRADIQAMVLADRSKSHPLFRVIGICNGQRHGSTKDVGEENGGDNAKATVLGPKATVLGPKDKMRDWTALLGAFQATNLTTGEVFKSGVCFLPNYVTDAVTGQLGADVESVKFAFDIYAHFDEQSATSYIFEAESLMEPAEDDPLKALAATVGGALPAPKAETSAVADKAKKK